MNRSIVGRLFAKDLYRYRWLMGIALGVGAASLVLSHFVGGDNGSTGLNLGILLFITTIIAFGIFIPMLGILKEQQDRTQLWMLSLPVSAIQYSRAKVLAAFVAFLIPWFALTVGVVVTTAVSGSPQGGIPFFVTMMTFFLANFSLLMAVIVITMSEHWSIGGILVTNLSVPVFLSKVGNLPGVAGHARDAVATWSPTVLTLLGIESALILLSLGLALQVPAQRKDFV